jgi:hypothetical protein
VLPQNVIIPIRVVKELFPEITKEASTGVNEAAVGNPNRDDDWSVELSILRSSKNRIGSLDPDALKIPARRPESTLTEVARLPFHAEPGHVHDYLLHYHSERNHQGKGNLLLFPCSIRNTENRAGPVLRRERLGGLLSYYHRNAA